MITERAWDRERRVVRVGDGGMGKNGGINLKDSLRIYRGMV